MKTSISTLTKIAPLLILLLLLCKTGFSQKSVNYESVGSNLEEMTTFFNDSMKSLDKISTVVVNELESLRTAKLSGEITEKVTDWSAVHMKELNEAAEEAKVWMKKQYFSPIKHSRKVIKELADKD